MPSQPGLTSTNSHISLSGAIPTVQAACQSASVLSVAVAPTREITDLPLKFRRLQVAYLHYAPINPGATSASCKPLNELVRQTSDPPWLHTVLACGEVGMVGYGCWVCGELGSGPVGGPAGCISAIKKSWGARTIVNATPLVFRGIKCRPLYTGSRVARGRLRDERTGRATVHAG